MKLVDNWKQAWRWFSVQALTIVMVIPLVWDSLASDIKEFLPENLEPWTLAVVAGAGLIGRLIDQNKAEK